MVTCLIQVVIMVSLDRYVKVPFLVETTAKGSVIQHSVGNLYLVNFSKEAKKQEWQGDYSRVLVKEDKCIE